jgi:hypothetical protein
MKPLWLYGKNPKTQNDPSEKSGLYVGRDCLFLFPDLPSHPEFCNRDDSHRNNRLQDLGFMIKTGRIIDSVNFF